MILIYNVLSFNDIIDIFSYETDFFCRCLVSQKSPYPFYVSVYGSTNNITRIIQRLLTHYIGDVEDQSTASCTSSEKASLNVIQSALHY